MFGIGFFELLIIAVFALVFVGPKKLPEVMRQAGKFFVHIRRTANDVRSTFDQVVREAEDEIRKEEASHIKALLTSATQPQAPSAGVAPSASDATHDQHGHHTHDHPDAGTRAYTPTEPGSGANLAQDATWQPVTPAAAPSDGPPPPTATPTKDS